MMFSAAESGRIGGPGALARPDPPAPRRDDRGLLQPPGRSVRKTLQLLGSSFKLREYWGPLASAKVGNWIAAATAAVLADGDLAPDLLLTYLPSLDYDLQRFGPNHPKRPHRPSANARAAWRNSGRSLGRLRRAGLWRLRHRRGILRRLPQSRLLQRPGLFAVRDVRNAVSRLPRQPRVCHGRSRDRPRLYPG